MADAPTHAAGAGDEVARARDLVADCERLRAEVAKVIVGQDDVVEQLLIALLAGGHCLLEGVPGLAKTLLIRTLARALQLPFRRIQFTPDLMPADITGTDIIQEEQATGHRQLVFEPGPLFAQVILADEINRTPPKTQAALLEAMAEGSVTVGGETRVLDQPFFVLATQNPIEQEGTYPLPEAQRDRFLFHVRIDYPSRDEERAILDRTTGDAPAKVEPVLDGKAILELQHVARRVPVPTHVTDFALDLVRRARPQTAEADTFVQEHVEWGPGPRAGQALLLSAKVRALLQGRSHATVDDVEAVALPVLRHRIVPSFAAESQGVCVAQVLERLVADARKRLPRRAI